MRVNMFVEDLGEQGAEVGDGGPLQKVREGRLQRVHAPIGQMILYFI